MMNTNQIGYEIDFLAVGEGEKSGDAIALRFGSLLTDPPQQTVFVIDGGFKDSGQALRRVSQEMSASNILF